MKTAVRGELLTTSEQLPTPLHDRCRFVVKASEMVEMLDEDGEVVLDDQRRPVITGQRVDREVCAYTQLGGVHFYPRAIATRAELEAAGFWVAPDDLPPDHPDLVLASDKLTLRPGGQQTAFEGALANDGGFIVLGTGRGKTVTALKIICAWAKPALIVFVNGGHLAQWRDEIQGKLGITAGLCLGSPDNWDWRGRSIALTTFQSYVRYLREETIPPEFFAHWGTMVWDEAHHAGAYTFRESVWSLPVRRLALSATPGRDGTERLLYLHIGPPVVWDVRPDLIPDCYLVSAPTSTRAPSYARGDMRAYTREASRVLGSTPKKVDAVYLDSLVTRLLRFREQGRVTLVHCIRTSLIYALKARIPDAAVIDQSVGFDLRPRRLRSSDIVLLSAKIGEEALDRPDADTIVLTFPLGKDSVDRLQQAGGRVLRLSEGKNTPEVWLFYPDSDYGVAQARANEKLLSELGFNIKGRVEPPRGRGGLTTIRRR